MPRGPRTGGPGGYPAATEQAQLRLVPWLCQCRLGLAGLRGAAQRAGLRLGLLGRAGLGHLESRCASSCESYGPAGTGPRPAASSVRPQSPLKTRHRVATDRGGRAQVGPGFM